MNYNSDSITQAEDCPACQGNGVQSNKDLIRVICPVCNGSGKVEKNQDGTIKTIKITWTTN